MVSETLESAKLGRYVAIYASFLIVLTIAAHAMLLFFPELSKEISKSVNMSIRMLAAMLTYSLFFRKYLRLLNRNEYRSLVLYCSIISIVFDSIILFVLAFLDLLPEAPLWLFVLVLFGVSGLTALVMTSLGYSKLFGNMFLKAHLKKQESEGLSIG